MKIAVLVKQVADTAARIELQPDGSGVKLDGVSMVLNPYDEFAVEAAIELKEKDGGEVVIFNVGPASADEAVKTALAMGADSAVVCRDDALTDADPLVIAGALAAMLKRDSFDLVLCGKQATDNDAHLVGPAVAELLNLPCASFITSLEIANSEAVVSRDADGVQETLSLALPALLTCQKGLNEPRYPSLPGIMQAARKPREELTVADLGIDAGGKVKVQKLDPPPPRAEGRILAGELPDQAKELVDLLRNDAHAV